MAEDVVNTNETLTHDVDSATLVIATPPDLKVKASNLNVYKGPITVTVSGASKGSCSSASGSVVIPSTATKVKISNQGVMRKTDQGTGTVNGTSSGSPCSFPITVTIQVAGQSKAKAE